MDKNKEWKALRVQVHKEDWVKFDEQAKSEGLNLASWVRQKCFLALMGDKE